MKKILFFTGAGISAESGIPTFGEQEGLRDKLTRSFALNHKEEYRETIKQMCNAVDKAKSNNGQDDKTTQKKGRASSKGKKVSNPMKCSELDPTVIVTYLSGI